MVEQSARIFGVKMPKDTLQNVMLDRAGNRPPKEGEKAIPMHGTGVRDVLEDLIMRFGQGDLARKLGTGRIYPNDRPYLRQYLNPGKDILPKQFLRPTDQTITDNLDWRQPATQSDPADPFNKLGLGVSTVSTNFDSGPVNRDIREIKYSRKAGEDAPFSSVYDKWDFNSENVAPPVKFIMDLLGKPYHVYGRAYENNADPLKPPAAAGPPVWTKPK